MTNKPSAPQSFEQRLQTSIAYLIDHDDSPICFMPDERDELAAFLVAKLEATYKMEVR